MNNFIQVCEWAAKAQVSFPVEAVFYGGVYYLCCEAKKETGVWCVT